jgi:predicted N-acetyltransferase YhbS
MNEDSRFPSLRFEPLSPTYVEKVHLMCEDNVKFISHELNVFKQATINSNFFLPEFSIVALDDEDDPVAFFMIQFKKPYVFKKRDVAVLKFFVVREDWRNKGLGTSVFTELLSRVRNSKYKCFRMKFDVMVSAPDYWYPGLDPRHTQAFFFLKKLGFRKGSERVNLSVDLTSMSEEKLPNQKEEFMIERAQENDIESLAPLEFMEKKYRMFYWPQEVRLSFTNSPISTFIARDTKNNKIVGWATHSVGFPGCFGPTGVSKKVRGNGLGGLLLKWCLRDLKNQGINECIIRWVGENTTYFYLKSVGARIGQIYWTMKKRI